MHLGVLTLAISLRNASVKVRDQISADAKKRGHWSAINARD